MQSAVKNLACNEASIPFLERKWFDYLGLKHA
jgi:hypothetical protein